MHMYTAVVTSKSDRVLHFNGLLRPHSSNNSDNFSHNQLKLY